MSGSAPVLFALLALAAVSAPVAAGPLAATRVTLRNGLRVVLAPDSQATAVDLAVWYPAGSRWEAPGQAGITRLVERLMFRGSAHVADGELRRRLTAAGGTVNTSATPDYSCFWETIPPSALGEALRDEADRMGSLTAAPAALEQERRAMRADRAARGARTVAAEAVARLYAALFPGQPYGRPPAEDEADADRLTARDVGEWRRTHYAPAGAVLTLVGRFAPEPALAAVRREFESVPRGAAPKPPALPAPPASADGVRATLRLASPARLVVAGWRGPGAADPDVPALEVLGELLGNPPSPLSQALIHDWNLAVATQGGFTPLRDASVLWTLAVVRPGADSTAVERTLFDAAGALAREAPAADVVERARRGLVTRTLFGLQTARDRAAALGEAELDAGDAGLADRRLAALSQVSPADVQRVAARVMTDAARGVVWVLPAEGGAR